MENYPAAHHTLGMAALPQEEGASVRNSTPGASAGALQIGMSRPALPIEDLPTPEEVFKVRRIGLEELFLLVLGPSIIALAASIGAGEWLFGPLAVATHGLRALGWVLLVSAVLQVFYNVELGRFTLATGEAPILALGRVPPGTWFWVPLALFSLFFAFILGNWTVHAGASLFPLLFGHAAAPSEIGTVRILGIGLLVTTLPLLMLGRKIERSLEISMGIFMAFLLVGQVVITLVVVPGESWVKAFNALITPTLPPSGSDPSLLSEVAGYMALASGLNFVIIGYYRDKGYAMGARSGFISGLFGGKGQKQQNIGSGSTGCTFAVNEKNSATWNRWFRFLLIDQWGVYFPGVLLGMFAPVVLVGYLAVLPEAPSPQASNIFVYAANQLAYNFGPVMSSWALITGLFILYTTQVVILELLARSFTDAVFGASSRVRGWLKGDPRRLYYPALLILVVCIAALVHLELPEILVQLSGNVANFAALVFPLALIYLNRRLPRPARSGAWSTLVLLLNVLFFGFFFINFVFGRITGAPLIRF